MAKKKAAAKQPKRVQPKTAVLAKASTVKGATQPKMEYRNDGSCVISHMEYVSDLDGNVGSGQGLLTVTPVNPQRAAMFTWLAAIATRFEMYRFRKLIFRYTPSCATTQNGYVILGFDFDAYDQNPTDLNSEATTTIASKAELLAWKYSSKSAPWQPNQLDVSGDSRISTYRYCDVGSRGDKRLDVIGNLVTRAFVPLGEASKFLGELFVEYTIEFRQPSYKIPTALYLSQPEHAVGGATDWLRSAEIIGNVTHQVLSGNQLLLNDVGSFLVSIAGGATSGITSVPTITVDMPTFSPSAVFTYANGPASLSSESFFRAGQLEVTVPPVLLTFGSLSGVSVLASVAISTFRGSFFT